MDTLRTPDERFADLPDFPFEPHYVEVRRRRRRARCACTTSTRDRPTPRRSCCCTASRRGATSTGR